MVCYNIYIFNRAGTCLYYGEWSRPKSVAQGAGTAQDDQKSMFGLFYSMKTIAAAVDPKGVNKELGQPMRIGATCSWHSFRTNKYKLHFFESPSGIKIVLNTDPDVGDLRDHLAYIYSSIYIEYVIKNPLYVPGQPIELESFAARLNGYIQSLGI